MGAVLSQVGQEGEKVVAYFSRTFNKAERRYCVTRRELLWSEIAGYSPAAKGLFEKFLALRVKDGVLQRAWKEPATGEERWQVVVPRTLRESVLKVCHGSAGMGHFGVSKTLRRVRQSFYWGQVRRDVEDFCRRCDLCTLQQLAVGAPMERVAVDIMGPFPRSDKGNRYVLVAMDYFTKWPEAYAIPDQEAGTVADALVEGMFSRFGAAEVIHSDQGRNFEAGVFSAMCERLGIQKTRTSPLHPQSDGLVERFNRTLAKQLAILTAEHQRDWDIHLPLVLLAYRSAVQDSTSCIPALLMLGRELRTPAEIIFGKPPDTPTVPPGPEYARRLQDRMESAHAFARDQLQKAGIRQKRNYDIRAKGKDFRAGDLVWVYSPKRKKGRCPKLDCHWVGPCEILEKLGEVVYRVQLPPRGRRVALHRDRLAPYRGDSRPHCRSGPSSLSQGSRNATPLDPPYASPSNSPQSVPPPDSSPRCYFGVVVADSNQCSSRNKGDDCSLQRLSRPSFNTSGRTLQYYEYAAMTNNYLFIVFNHRYSIFVANNR
uniref:Gypsy retrotransposon integrase-like protein 1 n=1 Tax=Pygocentrus nattereri TaxID=42514 RepID=A0AAR2M493_PYGNA